MKTILRNGKDYISSNETHPYHLLRSYLPFYDVEHETDSDTDDNQLTMVTDTTPIIHAETELGNDAVCPVDVGILRDFMTTSRNNIENHETRIKDNEIKLGVLDEQKDRLEDRITSLEEHTKDMDTMIERNRETAARVLYEQYEEINDDLIKPIGTRLKHIEDDLSVTQQGVSSIELQLQDDAYTRSERVTTQTVSHTKRVHDGECETGSPNKRAKELDVRIDDLERRMQQVETHLNNLDEWCVNTNSIAEIIRKQSAMEQWAVKMTNWYNQLETDLHRERKPGGIFEFLLCKKVHDAEHGTPCQKYMHHDGDCSVTSYGKDPDPRPNSEKFPKITFK